MPVGARSVVVSVPATAARFIDESVEGASPTITSDSTCFLAQR
jgi:hypothetical protein